MRDKPRHVLSILGSTVAHVVVLVTGLIDLTPDSLDLDLDLEFELVEVDLVELDQEQGEEKQAEPVQPPPTLPPENPLPPEPAAEEEKKEPEKPPEPEKPQRDLGQKRSNVEQLGPPNSTYHFLLSTRNIRKLPYARLAMKPIEALPDYEFLVTGGGFDALRDFDYIVIATPDLRSVTQTFLAVDYKVSRDVMKSRIEKAVAAADEEIEWIDEGGVLRGNPKPATGRDFDPRWLVLPSNDNVAFYMREEFLPAAMSEEAGDAKTTANFISKLAKLKKYAGRIPTAGVQFEAHDILAAIKRPVTNKFTLPDDIELTIEAQADPEINLLLTFASVVDAKQFVTWWEDGVKQDLAKIPGAMAMVGGIVEGLEVTRDGATVRGWTELERDQTEMLLTIIGAEVSKFQEGAAKRRAAQMKAAAEKAEKAAKEPSEEPSEKQEKQPPEAKQEQPEAKQEQPQEAETDS